MSVGPVQMLVVAFNEPNFHGEVMAELDRLAASNTVKVIDALVVYKDAEGELAAGHLSNLSDEEAIEVGATIGALVGFGFAGEEGMAAGFIAGAEAGAERTPIITPDADEWEVIANIPKDSAAALILLEHLWAIPLRDAVMRNGGFRISDGFISPLDLVATGLISSAEAKELHDFETAASGAA